MQSNTLSRQLYGLVWKQKPSFSTWGYIVELSGRDGAGSVSGT